MGKSYQIQLILEVPRADPTWTCSEQIELVNQWADEAHKISINSDKKVKSKTSQSKNRGRSQTRSKSNSGKSKSRSRSKYKIQHKAVQKK